MWTCHVCELGELPDELGCCLCGSQRQASVCESKCPSFFNNYMKQLQICQDNQNVLQRMRDANQTYRFLDVTLVHEIIWPFLDFLQRCRWLTVCRAWSQMRKKAPQKIVFKNYYFVPQQEEIVKCWVSDQTLYIIKKTTLRQLEVYHFTAENETFPLLLENGFWCRDFILTNPETDPDKIAITDSGILVGLRCQTISVFGLKGLPFNRWNIGFPLNNWKVVSGGRLVFVIDEDKAYIYSWLGDLLSIYFWMHVTDLCTCTPDGRLLLYNSLMRTLTVHRYSKREKTMYTLKTFRVDGDASSLSCTNELILLRTNCCDILYNFQGELVSVVNLPSLNSPWSTLRICSNAKQRNCMVYCEEDTEKKLNLVFRHFSF